MQSQSKPVSVAIFHRKVKCSREAMPLPVRCVLQNSVNETSRAHVLPADSPAVPGAESLIIDPVNETFNARDTALPTRSTSDRSLRSRGRYERREETSDQTVHKPGWSGRQNGRESRSCEDFARCEKVKRGRQVRRSRQTGFGSCPESRQASMNGRAITRRPVGDALRECRGQ